MSVPRDGTAGGVVHRWEWRVFGSTLDPGAGVLSGLAPVDEPVETDELYILGPGHVNVKIRFALLDVKKLMEVDQNGLQLWAPVAKLQFPVPAIEIVPVFEFWGLEQPEMGGDSYDVDRFLDELVFPHPDLELVRVQKRRVRYSIEGCMSELTSVRANDVEARTVAAESGDPTAVMSAVDQLGMSEHVNTSYNRGLRCLIGLAPVRYAVIDIGTNSVKFHIGEQAPDGKWSRVLDRADVTRLGEGLDETGRIQPEPMTRTAEAVTGMAAEAEDNGALAVAAVGTAAFRIATNTPDVIDAISDRTGVRVSVVSGDEESRLAYLAVSAGVGLAEGSVVVFDTGGGSTQFTFGRGGRVDERYSVNVGAVSYTERFGLDGAVDMSAIEDARLALEDDFSSLDGRNAPDALVGMGGAMTNITAVSLALDPYDPDVVQGAVVTLEEVDRQVELFRSMGQEERRSVTGLQPNRAPVILAGALVVSTVMRALGQDQVRVSDRGLRHGLIRERFGMFPPR